MALSLEGYLSLRCCCREMGVEQSFLRLPLRDAALGRGLLAIGSGLFREERFADALHLLQVALDGGLNQLRLREGQARALFRLKRYAEAEALLLELLADAEPEQRLSLNKVLRVCRLEAAKQHDQQDAPVLERWRNRLDRGDAPLDLADLEELAQLVLKNDGQCPFSEVLDRAIERRLQCEDPDWERLAPPLRRWQARVERTEVLLQGLSSRAH
jgi:tetratricopeptide (TPR) repeat protein